MQHVALYINETDELVCNGEPTYCITNFSLQATGVPADKTFYLEDEFVNHIVNHYTLDQLDAIFNSFYYHTLNSIYDLAERVHNAPNDNNDELLPYSPNTKFGHNKVVPLVVPYVKHEFEYDVHAAYAAMLMFQYYISDEDKGHEEYGIFYQPSPTGKYKEIKLCENPLKDVRSIQIVNNHIAINENEDSELYLCSRRVGYHREYAIVLRMAMDVISDCWKALKIDCSHLVYALIISQVMKSMYSKSKVATIRIFDALLQLSSIQTAITDTDKYSGYYSDAVFCKKMYSKTAVPNRIPGKRYYKKVNRSKAPVTHLITQSTRVVQDFHEVTSYGLGWASFDRKHLVGYDLDEYDMFHIDMKSAYPSRYHQETGKHIDKRSFGKIKCFNSRLYQKIRLRVSEDSLEIFKRIGRENVVYWKTDGGICLIKKGVDPYVLLDGVCQLHIDKIISSEPLSLPEWIKIPDHINKFGRPWAYKVKTDKSLNIFWANLYEECIEEILEYNNITLPDDFTQIDVIERINK